MGIPTIARQFAAFTRPAGPDLGLEIVELSHMGGFPLKTPGQLQIKISPRPGGVRPKILVFSYVKFSYLSDGPKFGRIRPPGTF